MSQRPQEEKQVGGKYNQLTRDDREGEQNPFDIEDEDLSQGSEQSQFFYRPRRRLTEEEKKDQGPPRPNCCKRCLNFFHFYPTSKQHQIQDRRLGCIFYLLITIIICYVIIYVLLIKQAYNQTDAAEARISTQLYPDPKHQIYSVFNKKQHIWDLDELGLSRFSSPNVVFIPFKLLITKGQMVGECANIAFPCKKDTDCKKEHVPYYSTEVKCKPNKRNAYGCYMVDWCPSEDLFDARVTEVHSLRNTNQINIYIRNEMTFDELANGKLFVPASTSTPQEYPTPPANIIKVQNILNIAQILNTAEIEKFGAYVVAILTQDCNLSGSNPLNPSCSSLIEVQRLDTSSQKGYVAQAFTTRDFVNSNGQKQRDLYHWVGLRISFVSEGQAKQVMFYQILLQFASAIGLMMGAKIVVEFLMLNCFPERAHFKKLKMVKTRDIKD